MAIDQNTPTQTPQDNPQNSDDAAVNIIRNKIDNLYNHEPDPQEEMLDAQEAGRHASKHQAFMNQLTTSGKSLAEIQTAWHNYYVELPDDEKHVVWQEFYQMHDKSPHIRPSHQPAQQPQEPAPAQHHHPRKKTPDTRSVADVKTQLLSKIGAGGKLSRKHHIQSILFGMGMGLIMFVFLLFGFFNERFVAPFISPSRDVSTTPIIVDQSSTAVGNDPKIIIPKINVEIPVVYDQPSIDEKAIQASLERGVVHYATTPNPGEQGNSVIVGHSSNNIFNKGKYKFAFVLLNKLENGDTFILNKDGKRYVYRIYEKKIVKPDDLSVLSPTAGKPATVTLITCDPPGTSINRLIVVGEQIAPDPSANTTSTAIEAGKEPSIVPGNAQSLWQRIKSWMIN